MYKSGRNNKLVQFQLYLNHYGYITVQVKGHTTAVLTISLKLLCFQVLLRFFWSTTYFLQKS